MCKKDIPQNKFFQRRFYPISGKKELIHVLTPLKNIGIRSLKKRINFKNRFFQNTFLNNTAKYLLTITKNARSCGDNIS